MVWEAAQLGARQDDTIFFLFLIKGDKINLFGDIFGIISHPSSMYEEQTSREKHRRIGYRAKTLLKIHDLMLDVALSASGNVCVCITEEMSHRELIPGATRHIFFY